MEQKTIRNLNKNTTSYAAGVLYTAAARLQDAKIALTDCIGIMGARILQTANDMNHDMTGDRDLNLLSDIEAEKMELISKTALKQTEELEKQNLKTIEDIAAMADDLKNRADKLSFISTHMDDILNVKDTTD